MAKDTTTENAGAQGNRVTSLLELKNVAEYAKRIGAEPRGRNRLVIVDRSGDGYPSDIARIDLPKRGEGKVRVVPMAGMTPVPDAHPTTAEEIGIRADMASAVFPEPVETQGWEDWPEDLARWADKIYNFQKPGQRPYMIEARGTGENGKKRCVVYTHYGAGEWVAQEPDGGLPLYNEHRLPGAQIVFIHEGPKAAEHCQWMVDGETQEARDALAAHPWGAELSEEGVVHLGWIGGANRPHSTRWEVLLDYPDIERIYIVPDNDEIGMRAVPKISNRLRKPTFEVAFSESFPRGFDLADPFPESLFKDEEGKRRYIGPGFVKAIAPATWMTDLRKDDDGKEFAVLRPHAADMWVHSTDQDKFLCKADPRLAYNADHLNSIIRKYSDSKRTSDLMKREVVQVRAFSYEPDQPFGRDNNNNFNLFKPAEVVAAPPASEGGGSDQPFLEFVEQLIPDALDRHEFLRWLATLIARPDIRMHYGVLLTSDAQGTGKSTVGEKILFRLVGMHNCSTPSGSDLDGPWNSWMHNVRLAFFDELYQGHGFPNYNALKSAITADKVLVNEKYEKAVTASCWVHILACSNSIRALGIAPNDRRWLIPRVTERPWPEERWIEFNRWLGMDGLSIIRRWAVEFCAIEGNIVPTGARAPGTTRKQELTQESGSVLKQWLADLAERVTNDGIKAAFGMTTLLKHIHEHVDERAKDKPLELADMLQGHGFVRIAGNRHRICKNKNGAKQWIVLSPAAAAEAEAEGFALDAVRMLPREAVPIARKYRTALDEGDDDVVGADYNVRM